ncbi:MAG: TPM domain-containing protein [Nonomuraea sp.]|nr:TPM domain-containing protein [Nonomuraea sp.]
MKVLTAAQADDVRQAIRTAERRSGLRFGVFLGPPVGARRHFAERLHAALGEDADSAVLVFVDVQGRGLEVVTGEHARRRLPDSACRLTAMSMATAFSAGDLVGGVLYGIAALGEQAIARR